MNKCGMYILGILLIILVGLNKITLYQSMIVFILSISFDCIYNILRDIRKLLGEYNEK